MMQTIIIGTNYIFTNLMKNKPTFPLILTLLLSLSLHAELLLQPLYITINIALISFLILWK